MNDLAQAMKPQVTMYTTAYCGYCRRAERLLETKGVTDITMIRVDEQPEARIAMMERTGRRTVPQIYIGDHHVGRVRRARGARSRGTAQCAPWRRSRLIARAS